MAQIKLTGVRESMSERELRLLDDVMDSMLELLPTAQMGQTHRFPGDDRLAFVEETIGNYIVEARS